MNRYEPMLGNDSVEKDWTKSTFWSSGQIEQKRLKLPRCRSQAFDAHLLPSFGADDSCTGCLATGWILYYDDELSCFFFFWGGESLTSVCAEHRNFFGARVRDFLENMRVTLAAFVIRTPGGGDFSCSSYEVPWQPLACEYHCVPSSMCWLR